jgi:hypothetical protein
MEAKRFYESQKRFEDQKKNVIKKCMWQTMTDKFMLECWMMGELQELVIVQFFPDGKGYKIYIEE